MLPNNQAIQYGVTIQAKDAEQLKLMIDKNLVDAHQIWLTPDRIQ